MSGTEQVIRNTLKTKEKKRKIHKIDLNERQKINFVIQHVYVCLYVIIILENLMRIKTNTKKTNIKKNKKKIEGEEGYKE